MNKTSFIPALRYKKLTKFFDFFLAVTFPEKKLREALMKQLQLKGNESILDFGSGTASLVILIKENYPAVEIMGIDVDEQVNIIADRKIKSRGLSIPIISYDGNILPFRNNTQFDKIISSLVFHHIPTAAKAPLLEQLYEITKSGGEILIADFGKPRNLYTKIAFGFFRRLDGKENTQANRDGLLPELLKKSGFSDVQITSVFNTAFGTIEIIKGSKTA